MDKIKQAFESLSHVNVLYTNENGDYMLVPYEGYDTIISREDFEQNTKKETSDKTGKQNTKKDAE